MKTLLIIAAVVVALLVFLILIVLAIGSRLNPHHQASRAILVRRSPIEVFTVIRDVERYPTWRSDVRSVEVLVPVEGKFHFREHGSNGAVTYEALDEVPGRRLTTRIVDQDLGYSGSWEYLLTETKEGTLVTITEVGEVSNPVFRFLSRYVFGHTATIDTYLTSLARHFGDTSLPGDPQPRR